MQDLARTFPELSFLHETKILRNVLQTYVSFRPDVGYVQGVFIQWFLFYCSVRSAKGSTGLWSLGMSYLAAMIICNVEHPYDSFVCFASVLNNRSFFDLYNLQEEKVKTILLFNYCLRRDRRSWRWCGVQIQQHMLVFEHYFESRLPALFAHFKEQGVPSDVYYLDWRVHIHYASDRNFEHRSVPSLGYSRTLLQYFRSLTLFVKALPRPICARIWDSFLLHGGAFLMRTALGHN